MSYLVFKSVKLNTARNLNLDCVSACCYCGGVAEAATATPATLGVTGAREPRLFFLEYFLYAC